MTELSRFQAPQADFLPNCYQKCQDWVKECEPLQNCFLASKWKEIKASYVLIWAGKIIRTHIKLLNCSGEQNLIDLSLAKDIYRATVLYD